MENDRKFNEIKEYNGKYYCMNLNDATFTWRSSCTMKLEHIAFNGLRQTDGQTDGRTDGRTD